MTDKRKGEHWWTTTSNTSRLFHTCLMQSNLLMKIFIMPANIKIWPLQLRFEDGIEVEYKNLKNFRWV